MLPFPMPRVALLIESSPTPNTNIKHLFVLITGVTKQDDRVLLVNFSSIKNGVPHDASCELNTGDHPFITQPTYIPYSRAIIESWAKIKYKIENKEIKLKETLSEDIFEKIILGLLSSDQVPKGILKFYNSRTPK